MCACRMEVQSIGCLWLQPVVAVAFSELASVFFCVGRCQSYPFLLVDWIAQVVAFLCEMPEVDKDGLQCVFWVWA